MTPGLCPDRGPDRGPDAGYGCDQPRGTTTSSILAALTKALKVTTEELVTSLASGTSLTDLAASKGVSSSTLNSLIVTGLQYDQKL